ncbi:MAG: hypothetical protein FJ026_18650 [Chloroflexi bacterium]|nr:hypothetical protein [Chloroflexota bacterium]
MSPRIAFKKTTPEGLAVDVEEFEGQRLLLLTKNMPGGVARAAQIIGIAGQEINTPTVTWYYEYEPLPTTLAVGRVTKYLESRGYKVGVFDQFGNFRAKAA